MITSPDSFYRLYQQRENELTRELEFRRIARERALEQSPRVQLTIASRLSRWARGTWRDPSLSAAQSNRPHLSQ